MTGVTGPTGATGVTGATGAASSESFSVFKGTSRATVNRRPVALLSNPRIVIGAIAVANLSTVTVDFPTDFTNATSYVCTVTPETTSGQNITIGITARNPGSVGFYNSSDLSVIANYVCIGN